jgi:hypothetical protein
MYILLYLLLVLSRYGRQRGHLTVLQELGRIVRSLQLPHILGLKNAVGTVLFVQ